MSKAKSVAEGIWWVGCGSWGGLTDVLSDEGSGNVFLIGAGQDFALLDAGSREGVGAVLANAAGVGAAPQAICWILLSHSHFDHTAGLADLARRTGAKTACSELAARAFGGDDAASRALMFRADLRHQVDRVLHDGEKITLGGCEFEVLSTPGHIPDAITLFGEVAGRKVVFTGDTAIGDQGQAEGVVGYLDGHWGSNPRHMLDSLRRIAACEADLLLPGHGFPIHGRQAVQASLEHCQERVKRLLAIPNLNTMMYLDLSE